MLNNSERPATSINGQEENRVSMLLPKKPTSKTARVAYPEAYETKYIDVDFDELKAKEPLVRGYMHPDLAEQARCAIDAIEREKEKITGIVKRLFFSHDVEIIFAACDAVYNDLYREALEMDGDEKIEWGGEKLMKMANGMYRATELAKYLLGAYESIKEIDSAVKTIKKAQKGILE